VLVFFMAIIFAIQAAALLRAECIFANQLARLNSDPDFAKHSALALAFLLFRTRFIVRANHPQGPHSEP
jgi:hypothetical protein